MVFPALSGHDAALMGGRFNPKGTPALYLGLSVITAVKEGSQGLFGKINLRALCAYKIDSEDVLDVRAPDVRADAKTPVDDLACPWLAQMLAGQEPPTWGLARRLITDGA